MNDPQEPSANLPRIFHSEYEDRPFQSCSRCGECLSSFDHYQINKAFRKDECIFEYVFCSDCRDNLLEEFSAESKVRMMQYQHDHMHLHTTLEECAFCLVSRREKDIPDFSITALCRNEELVDCLMICLDCQDSMHELLSEKTKDVRRRFFEDLPGVPPDWEDLIEDLEPKQGVAALAKSYAQSAQVNGPSQVQELKASQPPALVGDVSACEDGCLELIFNLRMLKL